MIRRTMVRLRTAARLTGAAGWTTLVVSGFLAKRRLSSEQRAQEIRDRYKRSWGRGLVWILGGEPIVEGVPPAASDCPRFVVCNHRTIIDIPLLMGLFGGGFLARGDMKAWPLAGWAAREGETILVNRRSPESRATAIDELRERLSEGRTVTVFSEGTTYPGDEVRPFHPGAFAAVSRGVDLVPVGLAYPANLEFTQDSIFEHFDRLNERRRIPIAVVIGEARQPAATKEETAEMMRAAVQQLVRRAREIVEARGDRAKKSRAAPEGNDPALPSI